MLSENYKKYFKMMMDKHGIKSLDQLSAEEKKKFFKAVDKSYKAKNEEVINENPAVIATAARMAIQNQQGKKVSVNTARQASYKEKDPQAHKKATSLFTKIVNKFKKKPKKTKSEPKKQSKSSAQKYADLYAGGTKVESIEEAMSNRVKKAIMVAVQMGGDMTGAIKKIEKIKKGLSKDKKVMQALRLANENVAPNHDGKAAPHGSGYKEMEEAKIQVQGIGMYDDKTLKKKIIQLTKELQKLAKQGDWSKSSENGIRALGRMWGAYQDYARNNESVNEAAMELNKIKDAILMFQKKIKKQGSVTNARDEDHLKNLIKVYKQMGGKGVKESMIEGIFGKFDTGAGFKGNGMTVYDRNQEKSGDFKDIAHIAPNGKITIYDKNVKKETKLMQSLNKISQEFKKTFKESVNEDVFAVVDKYNDKKQDYDQVYFKDNNLNKVKKHMKKMGSKYGKMNLIRVKTNGKMSLVERMDKRQAGETLKQLGGNKFIMMTGAKNFAVGPKGMGFKIGRNSKGVNYIRIDLDRGRDLYNMEFIQMRGGNLKIKSKVKGVYNDQLQKMFTKHTGMYTSLGTMGR